MAVRRLSLWKNVEHVHQTVRSPVNIQHVPTFRRLGRQHVVNICSGHPPSDGRALGDGAKQAKNRPKSSQNRPKSSQKSLKSPDSCACASLPGPNINILNIYKATGRVNIQHCCQHLQRMASTSNINSCGVSINLLPDGRDVILAF